jgi:hypothetical protein
MRLAEYAGPGNAPIGEPDAVGGPIIFGGGTGPVTDSQIQQALTQMINAGVWFGRPVPQPTANTYYAVHFAGQTITAPAGTSCTAFCGYHSSFSLNGKVIPYAVIPECSTGCNIASTQWADMTYSASHEMVETATDPQATAPRNRRHLRPVDHWDPEWVHGATLVVQLP